jgi:dihydroorotate dehydrogenase electron transfer subunit
VVGASAGATGSLPRLARLPETGPSAPRVAPPALLEAAVVTHGLIAPEYWRLVLDAPAIARTVEPGQFAMLTVARGEESWPVLPRPMAIYGWDRAGGRIEIVYRVVGEGTRRLTRWSCGDRIVTVGPLGRGFVLLPAAQRIVLLGRGIGTCSLTALAGVAAARGIAVHALVSARHSDALVGGEAYRAAGAVEVREVVDTDGSSGVGPVGAWLAENCRTGVDQIYACGSDRLLRLALEMARATGTGVQVSLEAHMACGLGFCHGCATGHPGLVEESPLVCRDGPVFRHLPSAPVA